MGPIPQPEEPVSGVDAVPSAWSESELIGACKVAWNESGQAADWAAYSADAVTEQRGVSWYVAFAGASVSTRACLIDGTPSSPAVTLAP